eukprot:6282309-Pyramimonas_sp.AAC.1
MRRARRLLKTPLSASRHGGGCRSTASGTVLPGPAVGPAPGGPEVSTSAASSGYGRVSKDAQSSLLC